MERIFMVRLFVTILNMSIGASFCILAVMLVRLMLRRAPKIFSYLLWAVVLVRLVCPVLPEANFGLMPDVELVEEYVPMSKAHKFSVYLLGKMGDTFLTAGNQQTDGVEEDVHVYVPDKSYDGFAEGTDSNAGREGEGIGIDVENTADLPSERIRAVSIPIEKVLLNRASVYLPGRVLTVLAAVWAAAALGLMAYAAVGYAAFMHHIDKRKITTPFVAGLIRPTVYLPDGLSDIQRQLVQEHEKIHMIRKDYLIKPIAFFLCCIYWFHPLVWVSFFLMESDMETSCDEAVIRKIGYDKRKDYANTLLGLSQSRGWRAGYPIAFGENHVKSRIKGVVNMKKAGAGVVIGAGALVLAAAALLLVNSPEKDRMELVMVEDSGDVTAAALADEETVSPAEGKDGTADLPEGRVANSATGPEIKEDGEAIIIQEHEYYSYDYLPEASGQNDIPEEGDQETIMNYDPSRARDQYEVLFLPQTDEGFDDFGILFSYPVEGARISDGFGSRVHPISGDEVYHLGIDFAAEEGTPIMAAADGTVVKTDFDADCGNYVVLLHENGEATYYFHCKEITAEEGDLVKRGEQIATVGKTGRATGAFVHFAVSRGGVYIEPEFLEDEGNLTGDE